MLCLCSGVIHIVRHIQLVLLAHKHKDNALIEILKEKKIKDKDQNVCADKDLLV